MLPHPARMCKHMRWGLMQRFPNGALKDILVNVLILTRGARLKQFVLKAKQSLVHLQLQLQRLIKLSYCSSLCLIAVLATLTADLRNFSALS